MEENKQDLILLLLREGSRNQAIKLYQEETGVSFFDARQSVAEIADANGIISRFKTAVATSLVVLALLLGILMAF